MKGLRVSRLWVSHFRSHLAVALGFDGRPVAVHGPNGAGKTNLIEAISLLSPGRGLRRAAAPEMARQPEGIGWKVRAEVEAPGGLHEIETWSEGAARLVRIDGKAASQTALGGVMRLLWLTPAMDRLWMEGAGERRRFLDRVALSLDPDHAEAALGYERPLRERNRLLRDAIADTGWLGALERQMAEAGAQLHGGRAAAVARLAGAMTPEAFPRAELTLAAEGPRDAAGLEAALREGRSRDRAAGRTLAGPHRDDLEAVYAAKAMPAALCSTGEQKALLVSLVLANARAVAEDFGAPPLLLLDEVAAHLDEARRAALIDAVCVLGAQAFLTGTDAGLFDSLGDRGLRLDMTGGTPAPA
jgi:DNA replication and repair protein RecF